jgi:hypothetical protein
MTTRMYHPLNGWTHAYDQSEIEALKKNGWEVECTIPGERAAPLHERDALIPAVSLHEGRDEMAPRKRKPGRPRKEQ